MQKHNLLNTYFTNPNNYNNHANNPIFNNPYQSQIDSYRGYLTSYYSAYLTSVNALNAAQTSLITANNNYVNIKNADAGFFQATDYQNMMYNNVSGQYAFDITVQ